LKINGNIFLTKTTFAKRKIFFRPAQIIVKKGESMYNKEDREKNVCSQEQDRRTQ
jgi:hypothetical protein